jgi:type IV pilus assembly protein PilN
MYGLDINFLKDRPEFLPKEVRGNGTGTKTSAATVLPLYIGVAVGLFVPAVVGGLWWFFQQENAKLEQKQQQLEADLGKLKKFDEQIQQIEGQTNQVNQETQALAGVFDQVKPWSAILQDIRDRIPPGVQIESIQQTAAAPPPAPTATPAPGASPAPPAPAAPPTSKLEISGTATSFNNVNDFVLTLQRSPFFKPKETYLLTATLGDNKATLETPKDREKNTSTTPTTSKPQLKYELPKVVQYKIQTTVTEVPASQLILELESKGATGLTTRLRNLQNQGVIKP